MRDSHPRTNPDEVRAIHSNSISTPDVLGVEVSDMDILDDDVLGTVGHTQTLSTDNTLGSNADQGLVRANVDTSNTSSVVGNADRLDACTCVAICAPRGLVYGVLPTIAGALVGRWAAAGFGGSAFSALEVVPKD